MDCLVQEKIHLETKLYMSASIKIQINVKKLYIQSKETIIQFKHNTIYVKHNLQYALWLQMLKLML